MRRRKIHRSYIEDDSMRKATFIKRKKGVLKKLHEISVLCGIEACAVISSEFDSSPEVWPSNIGAKNVVEKFEMLAEADQEKKLVNLEGFLKQLISKVVKKTNKKKKDNEERMMKEAMFHLLSGKGETLTLTNRNRADLCKYIHQYLKELYHHKNQILKQSHIEYGESSEAKNVIAPTSMVEVSSYSFSNLDVFNLPQLTDDVWSSRPMVSSSQRPEGVINTFSGNYLSGIANPQDEFPVGVYDHNPDLNHLSHNQYQQQYGYSIVPQDGICNLGQKQDLQENGWSEMMNHPNEKSFPLMNYINRYYQHP